MALDANGSAYEFVYDTTAGIPAVIEEFTPGGVVYYIRGPGGSLIARVKGTDTHYYHFDELGSTRLLTDGSGTVTDRYAYDAYGSLISHDRYAGSIDQPYQYVGQLGYYTHHQEPEFRLMQLGVRFYDAEVGRFGQRDSVPHYLTAYVYVDDSALSWVDSNGATKQKPPSTRPPTEEEKAKFLKQCKQDCMADQMRQLDEFFKGEGMGWIGDIYALLGGKGFDLMCRLSRASTRQNIIKPACDEYCKDRIRRHKDRLPYPPYEDGVREDPRHPGTHIGYGFRRWWKELGSRKAIWVYPQPAMDPLFPCCSPFMPPILILPNQHQAGAGGLL